MVTTLYLIRHGETEGSHIKRYKGSIDVPLSENGIKQIRKTANFIKQYQGIKVSERQSIKNSDAMTPCCFDAALSAVYCSPLSRALKSAEIVAELHGLKPIVMPDLRERSFGIWEGMSFDEIKERHPEEFEAWAGNPLKYSPMEGESTLEVRDRVVKALDRILNSAAANKKESNSLKNCSAALLNCHANIAIVAHGGVNRIILCHIMGTPLENIFRIEQDFAAVNIIEFHERYPVVKLLNYYRHL